MMKTYRELYLDNKFSKNNLLKNHLLKRVKEKQKENIINKYYLK